MLKVKVFIIFEPLRPDFSQIPDGAPRCRAMFKVTRRAFKLQLWPIRVIRVQGKLVGDFLETDLFVCFHIVFCRFLEIPEFIFAPQNLLGYSEI